MHCSRLWTTTVGDAFPILTMTHTSNMLPNPVITIAKIINAFGEHHITWKPSRKNPTCTPFLMHSKYWLYMWTTLILLLEPVGKPCLWSGMKNTPSCLQTWLANPWSQTNNAEHMNKDLVQTFLEKIEKPYKAHMQNDWSWTLNHTFINIFNSFIT